MRILIVDDQPSRLNPLLSRLAQAGIPRESVEVAQCGLEAERQLTSTDFDLLVIDILLPYRPEDEPKNETSISIVDQIVSIGTLRRPKYILGLSAYDESEAAAAQLFKDQTWAIVRYARDHEGWAQQIVNAALFVRRAGHEAARDYEVDVAVLTALRDPELDAVLSNGWRWSSPIPLDDTYFVHNADVPFERGALSVCAGAAPRMGMVSSALLAAKLIEKLRPRVIIMCGICAGVPEKVQLGDVLLADPSWDYQSGKRVRDKEAAQFSVAPHQLDVAAAARSRIAQMASDLTLTRGVRDAWTADAPRDFRIHVGPVASGSAVLADGATLAEIRLQQRELIGIEMEIYGVYAAARAAGRPAPSAIALKSVCDFADPDKADKAQKFAAFTSARVMTAFVERFASDIRDNALR